MCTSSHTRVPIEGRVKKPTHVVSTSPVTQNLMTFPSRAQALYFSPTRPPTSPSCKRVPRSSLALAARSRPQSASYAPYPLNLCVPGLDYTEALTSAPPFALIRRAQPSCSLPSYLGAGVRASLSPCTHGYSLCTSDTSDQPPGNVPRVCGPSS